MEVFEEETVATVVADCMFDNCDTPAGRKISGTAGHSAELHPCPWCDFVLIDLNKPQLFSPNGEKQIYNDCKMLKQHSLQPKRRSFTSEARISIQNSCACTPSADSS